MNARAALLLGLAVACGSAPQRPRPEPLVETTSLAAREPDTWTFATLAPSTSPSSRYDPALAYDVTHRNVVLFGGTPQISQAALDDTWIWDGTTWTQRTPATKPNGRARASMVFDAANGRVTMFGGASATVGVFTDVWTWDGTTWTQRPTALSPPAFAFHRMVFDAARNVVLLVGATASIPRIPLQMWTWNGSSWTNVTPTGTKPAAQGGYGLVYDAKRQRTLFIGGYGESFVDYYDDTWSWDGSAWSLVATTTKLPARPAEATLYHPLYEQTIALANSSADPWTYDGATWTQMQVAGTSARATVGVTTYDVAHDQALLVAPSTGALVTSVLKRLGSACTTTADCYGQPCVDGVCCATATCGTCRTCNGTTPGRCTAVLNAEDADSCALATGKSCSDTGDCKAALGANVALASDCASGIAAGGVCCNEPCNRPCFTCRVDQKAVPENPGLCEPARAGTDPRDDCAADGPDSCTRDGQCDGSGACRTIAPRGAPCGPIACLGALSTSRICDGLGACSASEETRSCGAFACKEADGCATACTENSDCAPLHHCENGECLADRGASCDGEHTVTSPEGGRSDCTPYRCEGASCKASCSSLQDCVFPAECSSEGVCVTYTAPQPAEEAGCNAARGPVRSVWPWMLAAVLVARRRRTLGALAGLALATTLAACSALSKAPDRDSALAIAERLTVHDALAERIRTRPDAFTRDPQRGDLVNEGARATTGDGYGALGARIPERADGPLRVGVSRFDRLHLRVSLDGARDATASVVDGRVVYEDVLRDTDRVFATGTHALSELLVLRSSHAPRTFRWRIELPAGIARAYPSDGGLAFDDDGERRVLTMAAPYALDAHGARHEVALTWHEDSSGRAGVMTLALPDRLAYPVVLDPEYETWRWYDLPLLARAYHAMAFDEARGNLIVFGGDSYLVVMNDTWSWNGTTWTRLAPAQSPQPRYGHGMAFDAARGNIVVYGGVRGGSLLDDTWTWDGTTWSPKAPATSPGARFYAPLVYDRARNEIVLFGGFLNGPPYVGSETWTWNGTTWTRKTTATTPPGRFFHQAAYDATRQRVVLFGGSDDPFGGGTPTLADTWLWDGTAWTNAMPATSPPVTAKQGMTFDAGRGLVALVDGTGALWSWNGATWASSAVTPKPPPRDHTALAYDPVRNNTVYFGGRTSQSAYFGDTWTWNGSAWSNAYDATIPSQRSYYGMAFDAARNETVMFGGAAGTDNAETWTWNGAVWTRKTPATSPPARRYHALVYDAARGGIVLFGGRSGTTPQSDTWTWNGTTWTQVTPTRSPSAREASAAAYDEARSTVVLFGGRNGTTYANDTWTWNGSTWAQATPSSSPTARALATAAFDRARGELVLFGGRTATMSLADTWTWNGSSWTQASPALSPSARDSHAMIFDTVRQRIVLYGGGVNGVPSASDALTWLWDGRDWAQASTIRSPLQRAGHALAATPTAGRSMTFGGTGAFSDTWFLYGLGGSCATNADCPEQYCVDGVCCAQAACGSCSTCNGSSPGKCTPVLNRADPDSCSATEKKSCDAFGVCKAALGTPAARADECASGFLADGVCCNEACTSDCRACKASLRESGTTDGFCGAAKVGTDPHDDCNEDAPASCGRDGVCDGRGACRVHVRGVGCGDVTCRNGRASGQLCDGLGACRADAAGLDCGAYACRDGAGCASLCTTNADCASLHHCEGSLCVADRGATCDGDHTVTSPEGTTVDCAPFRCEGAACKTRCASIKDCVYPASCSPEGACVTFAAPPADGGCALGSRRDGAPRGALGSSASLGLLALGVAGRWRRRGFSRRRGSR